MSGRLLRCLHRQRPSVKELRKLLLYSARTGILRWRVNVGTKIKAGTIAGSIEQQGYVVVGINGHLYKAHRIIWAMYYGRWPKHEIDHRNRNKCDNRITNLRPAKETWQNPVNGPARPSKSGIKGAHLKFGPKYKNPRWTSHISDKGRLIYLGCFATPEEAHAAYCKGWPQALWQIL